MRFYLAVLALACASCSTHWVRPGATDQDFLKDRYACERDVAMVPNQGMAWGMGASQAMFSRCMQSKGWRAE